MKSKKKKKMYHDGIGREWHGNWFPNTPGQDDSLLNVHNEIDDGSSQPDQRKTMGIKDPKCDDAEVFTKYYTVDNNVDLAGFFFISSLFDIYLKPLMTSVLFSLLYAEKFVD